MFRTGMLLAEFRLGGPLTLLPDLLIGAPEGVLLLRLDRLYFGVSLTLMPVGTAMALEYVNADIEDEDCACGHH